MTDNTLFLSRSFLRSYGLVAAWSTLGAGILLLIARFSMVAGFLVLAGFAMAYFAIRLSSLREGAYPRARVWVMFMTMVTVLGMGLGLRLFARGQSLVIWWIYLIGIIGLLIYTAVEFSKSIRAGSR